jgi:hypothetical protein
MTPPDYTQICRDSVARIKAWECQPHTVKVTVELGAEHDKDGKRDFSPYFVVVIWLQEAFRCDVRAAGYSILQAENNAAAAVNKIREKAQAKARMR